MLIIAWTDLEWNGIKWQIDLVLCFMFVYEQDDEIMIK